MLVAPSVVFPGIRTPSPRPASPFSLSFGSRASVHSGTMALPPDQNYSGVVTQHSPSSTPRVAGPGRRACSSILMPSNILAQSVCPRGKHLSSDSGPVAISMGCRERCGPCRTGRSPSRPSARSASAGEARRPRGRGRQLPPGERGAAARWPRAPASCGRARAAGSPARRALRATRSHARPRLACHLLVSPGRVPAAAAGGKRSRREEEAAAAAATGGGGGGSAGAAPRVGGVQAAQRGPGRGAAGRGAPGALPALLQCHGAPEEPLGLELGLAAEGYSGREPPHPSSNFLTFELIGAPRITAPG